MKASADSCNGQVLMLDCYWLDPERAGVDGRFRFHIQLNDCLSSLQAALHQAVGFSRMRRRSRNPELP